MARDEDRGVRDQAGIGPDPIQPDRLVSMSTIDDFAIADGEPDVRGWDVYSSAGVFIGTVDDLLIDPELRQVVMLQIDLKDKAEHARAPIKAAWLDRVRRRAIIDGAQLDAGLVEHRARPVVATDDVVVRREIQEERVIADDPLNPRPTRDLPPETRL